MMLQQNATDKQEALRWQRLLLLLLLAEFLVFVFSGVSFSFLHGAVFFNYGVDAFFGIFYLASIPQFIVAHQWLGIATDATIVLLLLLLIKDPGKKFIALLLIFLLFLYYVTLMGYLNHRNFHIGFVIVLFPFLFRSVRSKHFAYEGVRYYLLFFYTSAALFKLLYHSLGHTDHLSVSVVKQYAPYFIESNTGIRTAFNLYLIHHPNTGFVLLVLSLIAELVATIGFFTKRYDKLIGFSIILFHAVNWFIMDLAPFGQLAFICLLFMQRAFPSK